MVKLREIHTQFPINKELMKQTFDRRENVSGQKKGNTIGISLLMP